MNYELPDQMLSNTAIPVENTVASSHAHFGIEPVLRTKSGRNIKPPQKLDLLGSNSVVD